MRLILVRHGRTSSNVGFQLDTAAPGADLDEAGRAQADALVELLAEHPITAVYTSNLVRTQQTAAPVAAAKGLIPVVPQLMAMGQEQESRTLTEAVKLFAEHRVLLDGGRTVIFR